MTDIPEHLLARSQSRRAALGLGGGDAAPAPAPAAAEPSSTAPAPTASAPAPMAAVEEATPAAPPPPPYVAAALSRKKIPLWAMPVLVFLPVWGILYAQSLSAPPSKEKTQLQLGQELYGGGYGCAGCHGATGGGGTGRPFTECSVVQTFPFIEQQLEFVRLGTPGFQGQPYGDPNRPGGPHVGGSFGIMPAFAASRMPDKDLLEVVRWEREGLGGEKVPAAELAANGTRLWPNGSPMLDASGALIDPDGEPLFDASGKLVKPNVSEAAGGMKGTCS